MNTVRDEHTQYGGGTPAGYVGTSSSSSGGGVQQNVKLRNVLDKDVESLEAFLASLDSALAVSGRRYVIYLFAFFFVFFLSPLNLDILIAYFVYFA
jgi:hypothetical protein